MVLQLLQKSWHRLGTTKGEKKSYLGISLAGLCMMVSRQTVQTHLRGSFCFPESSADVAAFPGVHPG